MVEVKKYGEEMSKDAKFTVDGGKRTTSYNDVESFVKRVKALRKKGKVIGTIRREWNGTYYVWMTTPEEVKSDLYCEDTTPGYQDVDFVPNSDGTTFVRAKVRGRLVYFDR